MEEIRKDEKLKDFVDALQKRGYINFSLKDAISQLKSTPNAIRLSAYRLSQKKRIFRVYRNFYIILPLEYQDSGCLPPEWFIDPLMKTLGVNYYVGLLSAAALHGASHQQPMIFQAIVSKYSHTQIKAGRTSIHLHKSRYIYTEGVETKKTTSGYMNISSPELTAYDLIRYPKACGNYDHIATVLEELCENIDPHKLLTLAEGIYSHYGDLIYWQRLGYMLEKVGAHQKANALTKFIQENAKAFGYLIAAHSHQASERNQRWKLYINDSIKSDL